MNPFRIELQKLEAEKLPEINVHKMSKRNVARIERMVRGKLAGEERCVRDRRALHSMKGIGRLAAAMLAVLILTIASVSVYASRGVITDTIKRFFTREEELIDSKADLIQKTEQGEEVSLTVVKAIRDEDKLYLYLKLTDACRSFDGAALLYDSMVLERKSSDGNMPERFHIVTETHMEEKDLLGGNVFHYLGYQPVPEIEKRISFEPLEAGTYRLTFKRLFTIDERGEGGELSRDPSDFRCTEYADSLSVTFDLDEIPEPVASVEYRPMTDFRIGSVTLTLTKLSITPNRISLEICDLAGQSFELGGYTFPAIDYLTGFGNPKGVDLNAKNDPSERHRFITDATRKKIFDQSYQVKIAFYDDISSASEYDSNSYAIASYSDFDHAVRYTQQIMLTTPIYESDIERIYLERADGDAVILWRSRKND